jgi:hypothetical protein
MYPRNRLSPRYINIATTRYNELAGAATQTSPKRKKERQRNKRKQRKEIKVQSVGLTKTMMLRNRYALRIIPTTLLVL